MLQVHRNGWLKKLTAFALMALWGVPLFWLPPLASNTGIFTYMCSVYGLTLFIAKRIEHPSTGITALAGLAIASLVMLTVLVTIVANLPFPHPWPWLPSAAKFLYFFYPGIMGAVATVALLFYPLTKLLGSMSRFSAWTTSAFLLANSYHAMLHPKTELHRLITYSDTFSIVLTWFVAIQAQRMVGNFRRRQSISTVRNEAFHK